MEMDIVDEIIQEELEKLEKHERRDLNITNATALVPVASPDEGDYLYLDIIEKTTKPTNKFTGFTIKSILSHRKRGKSMKFNVVFIGFSDRGQSVDLEELENDHPQVLRDYVLFLEAQKPKSYKPLIESYPRLLQLIKN